MTKLDELVDAYKRAQGRGLSFRHKSYGVAHAMRAGFAKFLGCPPEKVEFRPVLREDPLNDTTMYAAAGVMEIGDDGYWHFALALRFGLERIQLHFMMRMTPEGVFLVKPLTGDIGAPTFEFRDEADDFTKVAEWAFERIKAYFDSGLDKFLAHNDGVHKIGFLSVVE